MIIPDHKKAMMTIMSRRKPGGEPVAAGPMKEEKVMSEQGEPDGRHMAAQDVLAAMHEKSPEKLMHALGAFHDLHMAHKDSAVDEN